MLVDLPRAGRPVTVTTSSLIEEVKTNIENDRRITLEELCDITGVGYGTVQRLVKETLGMTRVSARWVPRILTEEQMAERVRCSEWFLKQYRRHGDLFLYTIMSMDETLVPFFTPETKQQSSVWKCKDEPSPKKAKCQSSREKVMFMLFFDSKGVILNHTVPKGQSVNAAYYIKVSYIRMYSFVYLCTVH